MADSTLKEHLQKDHFAFLNDMKKLKNLVNKEIVVRRKQNVSLNNPENFATASFINSILGAFRKINPSKWKNVVQNVDYIKVLYELQAKVEKLATYQDQTPYQDHAGCDAACTGLCASCSGTCTGTSQGQGGGGGSDIDYSGGVVSLIMTVHYPGGSTFEYPVYYQGGTLYYGGGGTHTAPDGTQTTWGGTQGHPVGGTRQSAAESGGTEGGNVEVTLHY